MSLTWIDTHAHLDYPKFDSDRDQVVERALAAGVRAIVTIGTDRATSQRALELAERYPNVYAAVGIHPNDCAQAEVSQLSDIAAWCQHDKVVAIGEIGLDFYWNRATVDRQLEFLDRQLTLAAQNQLPVIFHMRDAETEMMAFLRNRNVSHYQGVFHCFPGDARLAAELMEMGFYISFTGSITFKHSKSVAVLPSIPLERLLTETDSPFMAPVPYRGQRNEPAYIDLIGTKIAELYRLPVSEVAKATSANAEKLFGFQV